jgi:hypothetical protein
MHKARDSLVPTWSMGPLPRVTLVVLLAWLVGCGPQPVRRDDARSGSDRRMLEAAPLDLEAGRGELGVPLSRAFPQLVVTPRYLMVFGGDRRVGDRFVFLGDGAVYDLMREEWWAMSPMPTTEPLAYPAAVWTGSEVVVLGTVCGPQPSHLGDDERVCTSGGVRMLGYDPERDRWRAIEGLDLPAVLREQPHGYWIFNAVGMTDRAAVFGWRDGLLLFDPGSGKARWTSGTPEGATGVCVLDAEVLAYGAQSSGAPLTADHLRVPLRVWRLDQTNLEWVLLSSVPRPATVGTFTDALHCNGDALVYEPLVTPDRVDAGARWWDPARSSWDPVPGGATSQGPSRLGDPAVIDGARLVLEAKRAWVWLPGSPGWVEVLLPEPVSRYWAGTGNGRSGSLSVELWMASDDSGRSWPVVEVVDLARIVERARAVPTPG